MMWNRIIWLFILFLLGRHICFPSSPRYLELADSADFYIARENWNRAEEKIIQALQLEPANFSNSLLLANLGLVQAEKKEYHKAIESLSLGLNIAPSSTVLLNNRAHTFLAIDSIQAAAADLDKSLEIDSIQEWTLQTRAFLALQNAEINKAEKLFYKLRTEFPENLKVLNGLAAVEESKGNYLEAQKYYKQKLALDPEDQEGWEAYIYLLIKLEDYTTARSEIKEALYLFPDDPMIYMLRGYLHRLNYRIDEANADKKLAISKGLDPQIVNQFIP